jgi:hypothetical protein
VAQHKLQVQQQQQQVAATTQASALKQLREAAPAARLEQQQGVAAFATTCNQLRCVRVVRAMGTRVLLQPNA